MNFNKSDSTFFVFNDDPYTIHVIMDKHVSFK